MLGLYPDGKDFNLISVVFRSNICFLPFLLPSVVSFLFAVFVVVSFPSSAVYELFVPFLSFAAHYVFTFFCLQLSFLYSVHSVLPYFVVFLFSCPFFLSFIPYNCSPSLFRSFLHLLFFVYYISKWVLRRRGVFFFLQVCEP